MLNHLRRLVRHSVVYGMAETVSRGTGFILVYIYGMILTPGDIGLRGALYSAAAFVSIFYTFGLDNAFLRYFMDADLSDRRHDIFSTTSFFSVIVGVLFIAVVFSADTFVSNVLTKSGGNTYIVRLLFLILLFDTVVIYPTLVLRAEDRLGYFSLVSFSRFFLFIGLNILLVWYMNHGLRGVFEANIVAVIIVAALLLPVYREYFRFRISFSMFRRLLAFGVPTIFTLFCMRIIDYSDRIIILYTLGDEGAHELGNYNMAYTPGMVGVMVFINSFRLAWQPFFLSLKDNPDNRGVFSRVATWYAVFLGTVLLGITLFRREIFSIYAPKFPVQLASIIPFVSLSYLLFGFYIIMMAGIFIREKTIYLPAVTFIAAALNLGLNFLFIPAFGIIGAAYTTVIAYAVMVSVMYVISGKLYHIDYDFRRLIYALILTVIPITVSLLFEPENALLSFFFRVLLVIAVPTVYLFSNFLMPDERAYLRRFRDKWLRIGDKDA